MRECSSSVVGAFEGGVVLATLGVVVVAGAAVVGVTGVVEGSTVMVVATTVVTVEDSVAVRRPSAPQPTRTPAARTIPMPSPSDFTLRR